MSADLRPAPASATPVDPLPSGLCVLVVDDDPSHLGYTRRLLGGWGITPDLAVNGADAVALAGVRSFDLILMDLLMPVLDGLAATKRIRAAERERAAARVPVLAHTSCLIDAAVLQACGLDGVLYKPCSPTALQASLLHWCCPRLGVTPASDHARAYR